MQLLRQWAVDQKENSEELIENKSKTSKQEIHFDVVSGLQHCTECVKPSQLNMLRGGGTWSINFSGSMPMQ